MTWVRYFVRYCALFGAASLLFVVRGSFALQEAWWKLRCEVANSWHETLFFFALRLCRGCARATHFRAELRNHH